MNVRWPSLNEIAQDVIRSPGQADKYLNQALSLAEKYQEFNALITVCADTAKRQVKALKQRLERGEKPPLAGVPYVAKDNYLTEGVRTTAGSNILKDYVPPYSATAINRLTEAGAILIGKSNLDAFAHGSSTENSDFGPTLNPVDKRHVPGGSSGGSTAAVKLGIVPLALGTDTGGSIRLPASFCGVVGLKPTFGAISRYGVVAMASSTDVLGPMAMSVRDCALALRIMAGADGRDATMIKLDKPQNRKLKGAKIGLIKQFKVNLDDKVAKALDDTITRLKAAGATVEEVNLPLIEMALAVYYVVVPAEVSSNLSRYDGVRYGLSVGRQTLDDLYLKTRSSGFNDENKRRILTGTFVLSSGYYDAYYKQAQKVRTLIVDDLRQAFARYDLLLSPTAATPAFKLGEKTQDPLKMYMNDLMTVAANLAGNPAISLPAKTAGLPVGIQLMAPQRQDYRMLQQAEQLEEVMYG